MKTKNTIGFFLPVIALLLLLCTALTAQSQSEQVTIGTGTNTSREAGSPFYDYSRNSTTAAIYTSTEIGQSGCITQIEYYCSTRSAFSGEVHIYMATLNKTTFTGNDDWPTTYTEVYSNNNASIAGATGWQSITLATPYYYDQSEGSLVEIVTKAVGTRRSQYWRYSTAANTVLSRGSGNSTNANYSNVSNRNNGARGSNRPNIRLTFKRFYFSATATANAGGTASVTPATTNVIGTASCSSATTTATFTATPNSGYRFLGWSTTADGAVVSTDNPYNATITSTSSTSGSPTNTRLYAQFEQMPMATAVSATPSEITVCAGDNGVFNYSLTPASAYDNVTVTSANTGIATVSKSGTAVTVTGVAGGATTVTLSAKNISGVEVASTTVAVSVMSLCTAPTIAGYDNATGKVTITPPASSTVYYTTDGSDPTDASTAYNAPFNLTDPATVKAIAYRDGYCPSTVASLSVGKVGTPAIEIDNSGVTFSGAAGATYYYSTDGSEPTTQWNGSTPVTGLSEGDVIKVVAKRAGMINSEVVTTSYQIPSGIGGGVVTLNDREDHSWSYYSDASLPSQLRSLNPADVKITYRGNGNNVSTSNDANPPANSFTAASTTVKVGIDAPGNTFVYYKTLERTDGSTAANPTGRCAYTTIPNPFSVRPTYGTGDTCWRGFYAWRVTSVSGGAIYDAATNGNQISVGGTINAEQTVYFAPTSEYSMQVELEALWARMYVNSGYQASVGYERNYVVGGAAVNFPATYSAIYPNGTTDGTAAANTVPGTYDPGGARTLSYDTKFEYINLTGNRTYTANNHYLCFGRGISTANNAGTVQGINANAADLNYTIRIESGQLYELSFVKASTQTVSGRYYIKSILGCDYDRATNTNNKLSISSGRQLFFSQQVSYSGSSNRDAKTFDLVVKSGQYQSSMWNNQNNSGGGGYQNSFYCGQNQGDNNYPGFRYVVIEGGEMGCLNGGRGTNGAKGTYAPSSDENPTFTARIKGGLIHGAVFGGAADSDSPGSRRIIVTGGTIEGWIAAGANGTGSSGGTNSARSDGNSYIYVGGNALCGGPNVKTVNLTVGGQVFGAGRGQNGQEASINNSNVVVADEAEISGTGGGNVYGGGYTGYVKQVSNVYVVGGTVENKVCGGAYGNAATIPTVNVTMTGGTVNNGVYGGSDNSGDVGTVTMHIDGGTVGDGTSEDGVYGGGYGASTSVTGNVSVTLGASTSATDSATVNGNVYGGSALGNVNTNNSNTTVVTMNKALGNVNTNNSNTTVVTMNKALINGNLFGGAYGNGAQVNGYITVNINGGRVNGSVFGGGDAAAYGTAGWNYPVVNMTGGTVTNVFGGGKGGTATVTGNPKVTLSGNAHVTGNVYGGGDEAGVTGSTSVKLQD